MNENQVKRASYPVRLESDRLLLRNMRAEDGKFLIRLWTDPKVTRFMGGPREKTFMEETVREMTEDPFREEYDLWILEEKKSGKPVGHCGLLQKEVEGKEEIELIYVLDRSFQGFGYATEISRMLLAFAFKIKKIDSVIALIEPENRASEKVAVKADMTLEKTVIRDENRQMRLYRISHA